MNSENLKNLHYALFKKEENWLFRIQLADGKIYRGYGATRKAVKAESESLLKELLVAN